MKSTGKSRDSVAAEKTKADKNVIIAETKMELADDELEGVAGGTCISPPKTKPKPGNGSNDAGSNRGGF